MKKALVVLAMLSSSHTMALEFNDFDFNPLFGMSWGQGAGETGGIAGAVTLGGEVIYQDRYLIGMSAYNVEKNVADSMTNTSADFDANYYSAWLGYFVTSDVALKAGYTRQVEDMTATYQVWVGDPSTGQGGGVEKVFNTDWSINYLMLGLGYHLTENLNINTHINIPVSGQFGERIPKSNYLNTSLMLGYRF